MGVPFGIGVGSSRDAERTRVCRHMKPVRE